MPGKTGHHPVEVIAQVQSMELNLDYSGTYNLLLEDGSTIHADFTPTQWDHLQSMHNRGRYPIKFVGNGDYADGRLKRITSVDLPNTERVLPPRDPDQRPFWEYWVAASKRIPKKERDQVPPDFIKNLDHYLYGAPKRDQE